MRRNQKQETYTKSQRNIKEVVLHLDKVQVLKNHESINTRRKERNERNQVESYDQAMILLQYLKMMRKMRTALIVQDPVQVLTENEDEDEVKRIRKGHLARLKVKDQF